MNPTCVPFGTTSRQRPGRGSLTTARQVLGATRTSLISKPSCGMFAFAIDESPVTVPTTSYQSFWGATAEDVPPVVEFRDGGPGVIG